MCTTCAGSCFFLSQLGGNFAWTLNSSIEFVNVPRNVSVARLQLACNVEVLVILMLVSYTHTMPSASVSVLCLFSHIFALYSGPVTAAHSMIPFNCRTRQSEQRSSVRLRLDFLRYTNDITCRALALSLPPLPPSLSLGLAPCIFLHFAPFPPSLSPSLPVSLCYFRGSIRRTQVLCVNV